MMRRTALCSVFAFPGLFALGAPMGAAPHLVADLNRGPNTEGQTVFVGLSAAGLPILAFQGYDPDHGAELWRSDGTPEGTFRLTDVCPGRCGADPRTIQIVGGRLYFTADDGVSGRELWRSDGTPGSERRVRDLCPGPCDSEIEALTPLGDRLLFLVVTASGARDVWATNGMRPGTRRLAALCGRDPESGGCAASPVGLVRAGGLVFFGLADDGIGDLWRSDGTAAGTRPLRELLGPAPPPPTASELAAFGDSILFWTDDALWRTDGTAAGTAEVVKVADIPGLTDAGPGAPVAVWNGVLYSFLGSTLVRTDGTAAGTSVVDVFPPGKFPQSPMIPIAGGLLFVMEGANGSPSALWRTGGTPGSTAEIYDFAPDGFIAQVDGLVGLGDRAVLLVQNISGDTHTLDLWASDGTAAGTERIAAGVGSYAFGLQAAGGHAFWVRGGYYLADDLWATDGTAAGTRSVHDFRALPGSSGPLSQAVLGDRLIFAAQTSLLAAPLFASDGTTAGTRLVSSAASWAIAITAVGNRVVFPAYTRVVDAESDYRSYTAKGLWAANADRAFAMAPGVFSFRSPMPFAGDLYFGAAVEGPFFGQVDIELWRTSGNGAAVLRKIDPAFISTTFHHTCIGESSNPGPGVVAGGRLLFAANDGTHGRELWSTDGTKTGTVLVRDINPGREPRFTFECDVRTDTGLASNPQGLVPSRNGALFTADDGRHGRELWWTDGTARGTRLVADLHPGPHGAAPHDVAVLANTAYFFAPLTAASPGEALWKTDGTAQGTAVVDDLTIGGTPSWPRSLTVVGGKLFFSVYNELTGAELWTSRGTAASTALVADLRSGAPGSSPQALTAVGNVLVFAADDGEHGLEPWRSDGTAAGTRPLGDIHPGLDASSPGPFSVVGGNVLTGAGDGAHGRELWAIPLAEVRQP
jgi:ELWxxDGT repeat protein